MNIAVTLIPSTEDDERHKFEEEDEALAAKLEKEAKRQRAVFGEERPRMEEKSEADIEAHGVVKLGAF